MLKISAVPWLTDLVIVSDWLNFSLTTTRGQCISSNKGCSSIEILWKSSVTVNLQHFFRDWDFACWFNPLERQSHKESAASQHRLIVDSSAAARSDAPRWHAHHPHRPRQGRRHCCPNRQHSQLVPFSERPGLQQQWGQIAVRLSLFSSAVR